MEVRPERSVAAERFIRATVNDFYQKYTGLFTLILQSLALARKYSRRTVGHFCAPMTLGITSAKCAITTRVSLPNNVQTSEMSS